MTTPTKTLSTVENLTLGLTEAARLIGKSPQWVRELVKGGYIKQPERGRYLATSVAQGALKFREDEDRRASKSAAASQRDDAKTRLLNIQIAERERKLIAFEEAEGVIDELVGDFKAALAGLPARVAKDPILRDQIERECDALLAKLSADTLQKVSAIAAGGTAAPAFDKAEI